MRASGWMRRNPVVVIGLACALALTTALIEPVTAQESRRSVLQGREPQTVRMTVAQSTVLDMPTAIRRASVADPGIVDLLVLSPEQLYLMAKTIGRTTLTLWGEKGTVSGVYEVDVTSDGNRLKEQLHRLFPLEQNVQVTASHAHLTLTGTVSSTAHLSQIVALAEAYAPKKVVNLLQVEGVHQVMLEVRIAEIERALLRRLGINWASVSGSGKQFGVSVLKNLTTALPSGDANAVVPASPANAPFAFGLGSAINALFRFQTGSTSWTAFIDALKEDSLVKVLAEPTLVALSGQEASFLAGGEFPVPVPQAFGVTTIQYKKFGVQLTFQPMVLSQRKISMTVTPEVSDLDFANGLTFQGFTVPTVTTRRASTTIEMDDGQSFAVAGLLRDVVRETISKFPVLGDIPILGALFRSSQFQKNETELIIVVTPRLAVPQTGTDQPLPTSRFIEPDDFDFYLMGRLQSANQAVLPRLNPPAIPIPESKMEGPVGHLAP